MKASQASTNITLAVLGGVPRVARTAGRLLLPI